jgi:hypothetical protein
MEFYSVIRKNEIGGIILSEVAMFRKTKATCFFSCGEDRSER